jgi:hypothetical protein
MANRTIAEQIAVLEARRTVLEAALTATSGGTASFSVDGVQQSYSNPSAISAELTKVEKSLQRALEERLRDHSNIAQQREAIFGKGD